MKRFFALSALLLALALNFSAANAQTAETKMKGTDFAGTWTLDKSKSQLPAQMADRLQGGTWTITQDGTQITREQKFDMADAGGGQGGGGGRGMGMMGSGSMTLKLDGSETTSENPRGKTAMKTKWTNGGKTLEINSNSTFGDMTITGVEHWELADGGKTLKVHQTRETPNGTRESTYVFTKK